jgi:MFS family permease
MGRLNGVARGKHTVNLRKLFPLYVGAAIGPMGGFGIITLIPVIARSWTVEFATASLTITFYMAPFILVQIFSGAIAQLFQARKTLLFGFAMYILGALLSGISPNLWMLLGSRILQGLGAGLLTPVIMALIGDLVSEEHLGKAFGLLGVAYTVGVTFGPLISGVMEVHYGWTSFFYFIGGLALASGTLYWMTSESMERPKHEAARLLEILPILKKALIQPGVLPLSFAAFTFFVAYVGIMTFTADHLKSNLDLPSDRTGILLSVTGFSGIIVSPIAGLLGDRLGRKRVFLAGTGVALFSIILMALSTYVFSKYLIFFLVLGTGAATAWTSLNTMAVEIAPALRQPVTSVYNAIKFSGYALSPVIFSVIYEPFKLRAVQFGCLGAMLIASFLASTAKPQAVRRQKGLAFDKEQGNAVSGRYLSQD